METIKRQDNFCGNIGKNIKKIRTEKGLTQDSLCKKVDLPYTTLTKLETGAITKLTIQTITKIAKGLDVSIDKLVNLKP